MCQVEDSDHGAESQVEPEGVALRANDSLEAEDAEYDSGHAGKQHDAKRAPDHLAPPDLHGNDNEFDRRGIDERGANRLGTGTCRNRISSGAVMVPAPTPVIAMSAAIRNPRTSSIAVSYSVA